MLLIEKSVYFYDVFGTIYGTLMIKFRLLKGFLLLLFSVITFLNHALDLSPLLITTEFNWHNRGFSRSSHPDVFCKKGVLKNFAKFLRTLFLPEHPRWLLLFLSDLGLFQQIKQNKEPYEKFGRLPVLLLLKPSYKV